MSLDGGALLSCPPFPFPSFNPLSNLPGLPQYTCRSKTIFIGFWIFGKAKKKKDCGQLTRSSLDTCSAFLWRLSALIDGVTFLSVRCSFSGAGRLSLTRPFVFGQSGGFDSSDVWKTIINYVQNGYWHAVKLEKCENGVTNGCECLCKLRIQVLIRKNR